MSSWGIIDKTNKFFCSHIPQPIHQKIPLLYLQNSISVQPCVATLLLSLLSQPVTSLTWVLHGFIPSLPVSISAPRLVLSKHQPEHAPPLSAPTQGFLSYSKAWTITQALLLPSDSTHMGSLCCHCRGQLLWHKCSRLTPSVEPLPMLFPLPGMFFSRC